MPEEYFTWEHKVSVDHLFSCNNCAYKDGKGCTRRPEMKGVELPPDSEKSFCLFGKKA